MPLHLRVLVTDKADYDAFLSKRVDSNEDVDAE